MARRDMEKQPQSPSGNPSRQELQEELSFIRQKCNSLSMRGHYVECVKTIEDNLSFFYKGERWPENFFSILRLHQKCYPSMNKDQSHEEYMTALLKKQGIPFVFAKLLAKPDSTIVWTPDYFKDQVSAYRENEDFETALSYADLVIKIDPGSANAYLLKGWILEDMGRGGEAVDMYNQSLEINSGNRHALNSLARYYMRGDPKKALEYLDKAIEEHPDESSYYANKSAVLQRLGDQAGALAAIGSAIENDPYNPEYPYQKAELLLAQGKTGSAIPQYKIAIALNEKHVPSLLRLVEFTKEGQPDLALTYINTVVTMEPKNTAAMLTKAKLQQRLGENDASIKQYKTLLELEPDNHEALSGLGVLYLLTGQAGKAAECLGKAVELSPKNARYHYDKGRALQRLERREEAMAEYKAATGIDKGFSRAWGELGFLSAQLSPKEAIAYFDKAIALDPENAYYHTSKGELLMADPGHRTAAIESLNTACRYDPGNDELHYKLAVLLEETDNTASAVEHLKSAIGLAPGRADAYYRLARLQMDAHPEIALLYIGSAVALDATNGEYYFCKGRILSALGANEQAIEELKNSIFLGQGQSEAMAEMAEIVGGNSPRVALMYINRAIELSPENPAYLCARAHLLYQMGQKVKARSQYEKLLKKNPNQHEALFGMARILADAKDKKALDYFDRAIAGEPAIPEYHAEKAAFLARDEVAYEQALEEYAAAIALNNQAWGGILEKARLYDSHGDTGSAMGEYRKVLLVYSKSVEAAARMGVLLCDLSPSIALVYLDQAVTLEPRNYLHYVWRGKALFALGREDAAADELRAAITYGGDTAETYFTMARILSERLPETALMYIRLALEKEPDKVEYLMLCGNLHFQLAEYVPAKECFGRAAALDSRCHEALERLAEIAYLENDPACDEIANAAHASRPECCACTYIKARILDEMKGDVPSAVEFMTRVVQLEPEVIPYREKLIELLRKKRAFLRVIIETNKLNRLRKKLDMPVEIQPPPDFEKKQEQEVLAQASPQREAMGVHPDGLGNAEEQGRQDADPD